MLKACLQLPAGDQRTNSLMLFVNAQSKSQELLLAARDVVRDAHHECALGASVFRGVVRGWCQLGDVARALEDSDWMHLNGFATSSAVAYAEAAIAQACSLRHMRAMPHTRVQRMSSVWAACRRS